MNKTWMWVIIVVIVLVLGWMYWPKNSTQPVDNTVATTTTEVSTTTAQ